MTLRPLQNKFNAMSSRERAMLLSFVGMIVLLWGSLLLRQAKTLKTDLNNEQSTKSKQELVLKDLDSFEKSIASYTTEFSHSYTAGALYSKVQGFLVECSINTNGNLQTNAGANKDKLFNINSV